MEVLPLWGGGKDGNNLAAPAGRNFSQFHVLHSLA